MGCVIDGLILFAAPRSWLREREHVVIQLDVPGLYFVPAVELEVVPPDKDLVPGFWR